MLKMASKIVWMAIENSMHKTDGKETKLIETCERERERETHERKKHIQNQRPMQKKMNEIAGH